MRLKQKRPIGEVGGWGRDPKNYKKIVYHYLKRTKTKNAALIVAVGWLRLVGSLKV